MTEELDFYQILGLVEKQHDPAITPEQFRQAYRQALLYHHPDKQNVDRTGPGRQIPTVDEISKAYRVLADPKTRREYDQKLRLLKSDSRDNATRHTGMETVDLEDLEFDDTSDKWTRICRCGSIPAYVVTEAELEKNADFGELITGCKGCSLWLKVLFTMED